MVGASILIISRGYLPFFTGLMLLLTVDVTLITTTQSKRVTSSCSNSHCILHDHTPAAKKQEEKKEKSFSPTNVFEKAVKIINFIKS